MKMKYIPPVLLILISWVILLPFLCYAAELRELSNQLFDALILPVCVAFPIILIANVYCACFTTWETAALIRVNFWLKLLLIPAYLLVLIYAIRTPLIIVIPLLFGGLLVLTSSTYGLRALVLAKREKQIDGAPFMVLMLSHLCLVTDVIAAVKFRQRMKPWHTAQNRM
ncbi:MAG: hypothetical protein IKK72_01925 [Oscillospiraceae bacterium]|nr:hypothetical protein [Oscillospiraceae bacterium]